jgi:hypothetical protein
MHIRYLKAYIEEMGFDEDYLPGNGSLLKDEIRVSSQVENAFRNSKFPFIKLYIDSVDYICLSNKGLASLLLFEFEFKYFEVDNEKLKELEKKYGKCSDPDDPFENEVFVERREEVFLQLDDDTYLKQEDIERFFNCVVDGFKRGYVTFDTILKDRIGVFGLNDELLFQVIDEVEKETLLYLDFNREVTDAKLYSYGYYQALYYKCWIYKQRLSNEVELKVHSYPDIKRIPITLKTSPKVIDLLNKSLKIFIQPEQQSLLKSILKGESCNGKIIFTSNANKLQYAIHILYKSKVVQNSKEELAQWLSDNWMFIRKKELVPFSYDNSYKLIGSNDFTCANPISGIDDIAQSFGIS